MDQINKLIENKVNFENFDKFAVIIGSNPSITARSPLLWNAAFNANNLNFAMLPLDVKRQNLQMELDQVQVASEGFTSRLKDVIDNPPEEPEVVEAEEAE